VLRGFDATQADIGVQRIFRVTERVNLRFRAEFFNILNHPNFANPTNSLPSLFLAAPRKRWRTASDPAARAADSTLCTRSADPDQSSWR
jgi:hypothetical protein